MVVIGREELPLNALESMGRAMFGDSGEPLQMVQPGAAGNALMPVQAVPYLMADGTGMAARVRVHPDRRIAALQAQGREAGTRQLIERLRLVRAPEDRPKRVILGSKVPLPGLPVSRLVRFEELRLSRFERACLAAAQGSGVLRLSAAGLAADAPEVFRTVREAEGWLERDGREAIKYPGAPNVRYIIGAGVLNGVRVALRLKGQRGRATPALVFGSGDPRAIAEAQLGELAAFEVIEALPQSHERETPKPVPVSTEQQSPLPKASKQAMRLVVLPEAEQIDSPLMRDRIAQRSGEAPRRHGRPTGFWQVIVGQPFLIWTRRTGRELAALIDRQPPRLTYAGAA